MESRLWAMDRVVVEGVGRALWMKRIDGGGRWSQWMGSMNGVP